MIDEHRSVLTELEAERRKTEQIHGQEVNELKARYTQDMGSSAQKYESELEFVKKVF